MAYFSHITDTTTGETRTKLFAEDWDDLSEFDWGENNRSCDCNRGIYFEDVGPELPDDDLPCGDGRFRVRIVAPGGGVLFEG